MNLNREKRAVLKFWGIEAENGLLVVHGQELIGTVELSGIESEGGRARSWRRIEMRRGGFGGMKLLSRVVLDWGRLGLGRRWSCCGSMGRENLIL
jgi:hypothetical protein